MLGGTLLPFAGVAAVTCGQTGPGTPPGASERPASAPPGGLKALEPQLDDVLKKYNP